MYVLATKLADLPVMSLQTGRAVATVNRPIINQANLEAMALQCDVGGRRTRPSALLMRDIRQFANDCIIIDSQDEIEEIGEIVRLHTIAKAGFDPIGKQVVNESGTKLGRVEDYTVNLKTSMVQKLYVHQSLVRSLVFNSLVIDRTQIIDITDRQFTVKDAASKAPTLMSRPAPQKSS